MMKPLAERRELSGQLDDFLSDDTAPEGVARRDLGLSEERHVFDELVINTLHLEVFSLDFHLGAKVVLYQSFKVVGIVLVERRGSALVLGMESKQSVEDDVELLRNPEFIPAGNGHFFGVGRVGIPQTLLKVKEFHLERNLDLGSNASSKVGAELSGVPDEETVG
jgi:hypothetical protein